MAVTFRPEPFQDEGTHKVDPKREETVEMVGDNSSTGVVHQRDTSLEDKTPNEPTGRVEPTRVETVQAEEHLVGRDYRPEVDREAGSYVDPLAAEEAPVEEPEAEATEDEEKAKTPRSNKAKSEPTETK